MARIDKYEWGMEYEELEGAYFIALHELDDKNKQIAELKAIKGKADEAILECLTVIASLAAQNAQLKGLLNNIHKNSNVQKVDIHLLVHKINIINFLSSPDNLPE